MFNYFISDKSVTYKTEILCFSWLSVRSAARSLLNGREPNIFQFGLTKLIWTKLSYDHYLLKIST